MFSIELWALCLLGVLSTSVGQMLEPATIERLPTLFTPEPRTTTTPEPCRNDHFLVYPRSVKPGHNFPVLIYVNGNSNGLGLVHVNVSLFSQEWDRPTRDYNLALVTNGHITMTLGTSSLLELAVPIDVPYNWNFLLKSTGSGALSFQDSAFVSVTRMLNATFIQTDKATYRPGEEVKFWIFAIYPNMTTVLHTAFDVTILDPRRNKIYEATINSNAEGLAEGSIILPDKPPTGEWFITATLVGSQNLQRKPFTVEQYVLPRFQVIVTLPEYIITSDTHVRGTISVKYTYGEPVSGQVLITATVQPRWCYYCKITKFVQKLKPVIDGEVTFEYNMDDLKTLSYYNRTELMNEVLHVTANVTEGVTGIILSGKASSPFHKYLRQVTVPLGVPAFKPGLLYRIMVMVADPSGDPLESYPSQLNVTVYTRNCTYIRWTPSPPPFEQNSSSLNQIEFWPGRTVCDETRLLSQMHSVPDTGMVLVEFPDTFSFNTSSYAYYGSNVMLKASYEHVNNSYIATIQKAESVDNSFMRITLSNSNPVVGQSMTVTVVATSAISGVFYTVIAKGNLELLQRYDLPGGQSMTTFHFTFTITQAMTPRARLVVFHSEGSEIVADGISFAVQGLFQNQVSLQFQPDDLRPGDETTLTITADPGSLAAVLTVDKSVLLHRSGNRILTKDVMNAMRSFDFGYYGGGYFIDIMFYGGMWPIWRPDRTARDVFSEGGIAASPPCLLGEDIYYLMASRNTEFAPVGAPAVAEVGAGDGNNPDLAEVQLERKLFPETFIWQIVPVGPSGRASIVTNAPHTITSWVASVFALNDNTGLGIANETEMRVFLPFFVSMNLPRTAIRGETLLVQVIVFNYYPSSMEVMVTFSRSLTHNITVQANGIGSAYFPIRPLTVGTMKIHAQAQSILAADAVEKSIEIMYEGIETCNVVSYLIMLDEFTSTFADDVDVTFPISLVADSVRVSAFITGDTMVGVFRNPERLVRLPAGCGEQTIRTFASLVHVMNYMDEKGTMNDTLRAKGTGFLRDGYINELKFQHNDGSFSTWGPTNGNGGMMSLTAFVVKSFKPARAHIFIDPIVISRAVNWIFIHQNPNGSFSDVGRSFAYRLKGDVLTAYVLIAMSEGGLPEMTPNMAAGIEKAADYIETASQSATKPHHLAMYAYALSLAGRRDAADRVIDELEKLQQPGGLMTYWINNPTAPHRWWCWYCGRSDDVETAAYAILTYKWRGEITEAFMVLKWLVKQQNSYGGFLSTQDTAIAIHAMSVISLDISSHVNMTILLEAPTFNIPVIVDDTNRLDIQSFQVALPLNISARGTGASIVKIEYCYNVLEPEMPEGFDLTTTIVDESLMSFTLEICFRYKNGNSTEGMVVVIIGLPTGFEMESVTGIYDKIEVENKIVTVYLTEVTSTEECLTMLARRAGRQSSGTKDVPVDIINYYDPDETACNTYVLTADGGNYCMICDGQCTVC